MSGDAGDDALKGDAHEMVANPAGVVAQSVLAAVEVHVQMDGRKPHNQGSRGIGRSFADEDDFETALPRLERGFDRRATGRRAATADERIGFDDEALRTDIAAFLRSALG
jgi:hypothetical protein